MTHRVVALVIPSVILFDLAIPAEVFGHSSMQSRYRFAVCTETPGSVATVSCVGMQIDDGLDALDAADTIVVPGYYPRVDPSPIVAEKLAAAVDRGGRVASVCVGAFALAGAGLLAGRAATTHWQFAGELAERFPDVAVRPDVLYVDEGPVLTSAGITAGVDLCLHMVRTDHGAAVANDVSRRMVAAMHRSGGQAQFVQRPIPETGQELAATCEWALRELDTPLNVARMAGHAHMSPRHFTRRFAAETGITPMRWVAAQRVLEARRLLETTDLPVEQIAQRCGLGSAANLRAYFAREVATTPTAYRNAYRDGGARRLR